MRHYLALCEEWKKRPPTRWLKAAQLQYKPPSDEIKMGPIGLKPTSPRSPEAEARRLRIIAEAKARGELTVDDIPLTGQKGSWSG